MRVLIWVAALVGCIVLLGFLLVELFEEWVSGGFRRRAPEVDGDDDDTVTGKSETPA